MLITHLFPGEREFVARTRATLNYLGATELAAYVLQRGALTEVAVATSRGLVRLRRQPDTVHGAPQFVVESEVFPWIDVRGLRVRTHSMVDADRTEVISVDFRLDHPNIGFSSSAARAGEQADFVAACLDLMAHQGR